MTEGNILKHAGNCRLQCYGVKKNTVHESNLLSTYSPFHTTLGRAKLQLNHYIVCETIIIAFVE